MRGPESPNLIPELMAYMTTILHVSQDFAGFGWVRYDAAFRCLVAMSGDTKWSEINPTLYAMFFTGATRTAARCDLCMATSHRTTECALFGHQPSGFQDRPHTLEPAVRPPHQLLSSGPTRRPPSGEICRLWNKNSCTFARCRHTHICAIC